MARGNTYSPGFPVDPVSDRKIGQTLGYTLSPGGLIVPISADNPAPTQIYGPNGEAISVDGVGDTRALVVHNEDVDTDLINLLMHEEGGTSYTLASPIAVGDTEITLTNATGLAVGERLEITEGTNFQKSLPVVTDISGAPTIVLDGPMDAAYTVAATIEEVLVNMAVAGSLAAPKSYITKPHSSEIWHLTRMNFSMVHKSASTDDLFGSLAALVNGVVLRSHTALNGIRTMANWKANKDFIEDMFDVQYSAKAGGTNHGTSGRWSFKQRTDTIVRLDGSTDDFLETLIQDDLTATSGELVSFQIKMQGHIDEIQ